MFRYKSGIPMSYNRQGYVYFASRLYKHWPQEVRNVIDGICRQAVKESNIRGGQKHYVQALTEFVTTDIRAEQLECRYGINRDSFYRCVRAYYMLFPERV